jgi:hypothetical protein
MASGHGPKDRDYQIANSKACDRRHRPPSWIGRINEDDVASPPDDTAFFLPLMIAVATTLGTIVIHALAVAAVVEFIRYERKLHRAGVRFWRDVAIVGGVTLLALAAHLIEITACC